MEEKRKEIPLRPHHGMCLAFFEGKGYSDTFVDHMREVLDSFTEGASDCPVLLVEEADAICEACPHRGSGVCEAEERVLMYDRKVLSICGLRSGQVMPFRTFAARVQQNILLPGKRKEICAGCQWEEYCERRISRWEKMENGI